MAKMTIDKLAQIINKGFDGQMDYMEKKFDDLKKDMTFIKGQLVDKEELNIWKAS